MNVSIQKDWKALLSEEFEKDYFGQLVNFVKSEYQTQTIYPPGAQIFAAFDTTPPQDVKVVILGQDPYHGAGQANGLCFSVAKNIAIPPSLINIFKEIEHDTGKAIPTNGDLTGWAEQGVLLLNATLTVRANQAGSHQKQGWETFTDAVIQKISNQYKHIVFMLWGGYAKKKIKLINANDNLILTSGHPSPLSANRGYWFGNKHFSKANKYLISKGKEAILW